MARPLRDDPPGGWHHVMNRGVGKRTIFETRQDTRFFLSRVARTVRRGDIEVHAYCAMPNHFHMLVRSPQERLSAAMQWLQDGFARYFNRSRNRTGSVFGGRFKSKRITTKAYWHSVIWYIDQNPVEDRLVSHPADYPWCSAWQHRRAKGPPWLARDITEGAHYAHEAELTRLLSTTKRERVLRLIEMRMDSNSRESDPLEILLNSSPDQVQTWIRNRALNADGIHPGLPVAHPDTVLDVLHIDPEAGSPPRDLQVMASWVLSVGCGADLSAIAACLGISRTTAHRRVMGFRERIENDPGWVLRAEQTLRECLSRDYPFQKVVGRSLTRLFHTGK